MSALRRGLAATLLAPLLPARLVGGMEHLAHAEALVGEGQGLLVLMNHFSKRDGLQVLRLLFSRPLLRQRSVLVPAASHLAGPPVRTMARLFAVNLALMTTPAAVTSLGLDPATGEDALAYARRAINTLAAGGIVLLAPQAGRQPTWGEPQMRVTSHLRAPARRQRVTNFALLFVGLGLPGAGDYSLARVGDLNLGRPYQIHVGPTFTYEEALAAAGSLRRLDPWVFEQLRQLVPEGYRDSRLQTGDCRLFQRESGAVGDSPLNATVSAYSRVSVDCNFMVRPPDPTSPVPGTPSGNECPPCPSHPGRSRRPSLPPPATRPCGTLQRPTGPALPALLS